MKSASTFKYLGLVAAATLLLAGCGAQTPTNENVNAEPTPEVSATPSGSPAGEAEDNAINEELKVIDTTGADQELNDIEAELQ